MTTNTAHPGNVAGIRAARPARECRAERCEIRLNIGVFFDGTGNNARWVEPDSIATQEARQKDSNVYRLWGAYPEDPAAGNFRFYVPGVGTPLPEIGEHEASNLGMGFGAGGEGRIVFGLLQTFNAVHMAIDPRKEVMFPPAAIEALCRYGRDPDLPERSQQALRPLGMHSGGLLSDAITGQGARRPFLLRHGTALADKIAGTDKPKLVEIFIDVFGFSRGAAEARVFCTWLNELFQGNNLFGVRAGLRFVGLFDTVASVGVPTSATPFSDGHMTWADDDNLRIPARTWNCEHYIAAHENRGSFPVEEVNNSSGFLPANCRQFVFPGMHSDVGGGYTPQEQGRGPNALNSEKLAQIPLNRMYEAACAARVPLNKSRAVQGTYDPFEIADSVQAAYDAWLGESGGAKPLREWLLPYLTWRYQVRNRYTRLPWWQRADARARENLEGANDILLADIESLEDPPSSFERALEVVSPFARWVIGRNYDSLAPEAPEILRRAKAAPPTSTALADLFGNFVHDSYAGFRPLEFDAFDVDILDGWEPEGYLRWRVHYRGNNERLTLRRTQQQTQAA